MMLRIVWTLDAAKSFQKVISFIETSWTKNDSKKFISKLNKVVNQIAKAPEIFLPPTTKTLEKLLLRISVGTVPVFSEY